MTKKNLSRLITGIVILMAIVPFIFVVYLNQLSTSAGSHLADYLAQNPLMNLQMIATFLMPFYGLILKTKWDKLKEQAHDYADHYLYLSTVFLMFGQFILGNIFYGILFIIVLVFVTRIYSIGIVQAFKSLKSPSRFLKSFAGELVIVILSIMLQIMASRIR